MQAPVPRASDETIVSALGALGIVTSGAFLATLVSLNWLRPDISPTSNYVSEYANGAFSWLFRGTSFAHGVGNLAIGVGLMSRLATSKGGRAAAALFGLSAIGILVAAIFAADAKGSPETYSGTTHLIAAFTSFLIEAVAMVVMIATLMARFPASRALLAVTIVLLAAGTNSLSILLFDRSFGFPPGIAERVALGAFLAWEILLGILVWRDRIPTALASTSYAATVVRSQVDQDQCSEGSVSR